MLLKSRCNQIARISLSSSVGYLRNERIIAHVIVERVSNMKGRRESSWQQHDECHHTNTEHLSKEMPMLGVERWTAHWHGWVVACMPTYFWRCVLCVWTVSNTGYNPSVSTCCPMCNPQHWHLFWEVFNAGVVTSITLLSTAFSPAFHIWNTFHDNVGYYTFVT